MGLISFIRDAGHKLFGGTEEAVKPPSAPAPAAPVAAKPVPDPRVVDAQRAASILDHIRKTGLVIQDPEVKVEGDRATISGRTTSQEMREKVALTVGNVLGIAEVDDNIVVEKPEPEATYYTVKAGDTLSKIARTVYGNSNKYEVIFQANKPMLSHPDKIYPGQVLRIPAQPEAPIAQV